MSRQRSIKSDIKYQLLMSFLGLFLVVLLIVFPPAVIGDVPWRKQVIGSLFSIICVLGVLAVFSPTKCLKIFNIGKKNTNGGADSAKPISHGTSNSLAGHHPNCGNYDAHVFWIKGKAVCAACSGLLLGGILALGGATVYFFGDWKVADYSFWIVLLGVAGISFGLFQFKFSGFMRLSVNTVFVFGALLIMIGIDGLVHSLVFDLFAVSLVIFWLYTRISLSQWDHEVTCSSCEVENCKVRE